MARHEVQHSFESDDDNLIVVFDLVDGKVTNLVIRFRNGDAVGVTPPELVDFAATINKAAEWVMAIGLREPEDEP